MYRSVPKLKTNKSLKLLLVDMKASRKSNELN